MEVMVGMKRELCRSIKNYMQVYGVYSNIYYPTKYRTIYAGVNDPTVEYEEEPSLRVKTLTKDNFGESFKAVDFIDNLFAEENRLYLPCDTELIPVSSLVVFTEEESMLKGAYQITAIKGYKYRGSEILKYYEISPVSSKHDGLNDDDDMSDAMYEEREAEGHLSLDVDEIMGDSITDVLNKDSIDEKLEEIDSDKILNKRKVNKFNLGE